MTIELAKTADVPAVAALYEALINYLNEANVNYPRWAIGLYPTIGDASAAQGRGGLFVGRVEGGVAASVILNNDCSPLYDGGKWSVSPPAERVLAVHTLCVHPLYMRRGFAAQLLAFAEERGRQAGCVTVRLDTAVQNAPGIALYESHGYRCVGIVDLKLGRAGLTVHRLYEKLL